MCHMTNPLYELLKFDKLSIFLHLKCVFSQNLINTLLICNFTINILESADPWMLDQVEFKTHQFVKFSLEYAIWVKKENVVTPSSE